MTFEIINDIEIPEATKTRNRQRGAFSRTLDSLEVGQGFVFESPGTIKSQYPKVSPAKFGGKKFKIWKILDKDGNAIEGNFGVKRIL